MGSRKREDLKLETTLVEAEGVEGPLIEGGEGGEVGVEV